MAATALAAAVLLGACSSGGGVADSSTPAARRAVSPPAATPTTTSTVPGAAPLSRFDRAPFTVTDAAGRRWPLCLWLAATDAERSQGLMGVTDPSLAGADGMAFRFDGPTTGAFWMRATPMALSIAFFDAAGRFVYGTDMAPCGDRDDCPLYGPGSKASYVWAVEVPAGGLAERGIATGSVLAAGKGTCSR